MNEIEHVDVLIIGTGPSGSSTALHLIKTNPAWARRIVMVDKAVHPREKLCGGGITHMGLNILANLGLPLEPESFPVREARLVYHEKSYSFYGDPVFRIVRRDEFDHWLVITAEKLGIRVHQGEAVTDISPKADYVEVVTERTTYHATVVVGADGSRSFVRRKLKWEDESGVARLIEVLTPENPSAEPEFQEGIAIFDFTPMDDGLQGYYWDFPSYVNGQAYMNRGVFDSRTQPEKPKADLKEVLSESMAERERSMDDYKLKGHPIRWWDRRGRFSQPHVLLVGDAAGADPLFGEGISFALGYGEVAAAEIVDAFTHNDFSFRDYPEHVGGHRLFKQLRLRSWAAQYAYLLNYPWLVNIGWGVMRAFMYLTPWRRRDYVPVNEPEFRLTDIASST